MKLTQQEAARRMKCSIKTIYRYEHGVVKRYNPSTMAKFAVFYNVDEFAIWKESNHEER